MTVGGATTPVIPDADRARRLPRLLAYYLVAVLGPLVTACVRYALDPIWGNKFPFTTFYPAVALTAWLGGLGPGLLATALATAGALWFLPPLGGPWRDTAPTVVAITLFTAVNVLISVLSEALHRARRRAEVTRDSLRESEARLRGVVTSATDAIITIDHGQRITLFNAGAEAVFGYTAAEMIGQRLDRLIPERFQDVHRHHVAAFGATGVSMRVMGGERVLAGVRRNGEEFPIEARISQVEVAGQTLYTVILRDITDRKRADAEREQLLAIAQQARDGAERAQAEAERAATTVRHVQRITDVMMRDLPLDQLLHEVLGRVREVLQADLAAILLADRDDDAEDVLRIRATSGIGRDVPEGFPVPVGRGFAGQLARERRAIVSEDVQPEDVFVPCRKTVRAFAGVPLLSGDRLLGVLLAGSLRPDHFHEDDLDLLQVAGERIALGVERTARTDAEQRARETLEASNRAKDEFLAMLAHELRNPLAAVQSAVVAAGLDESRRGRALEIARRQADQLGRLIDDLLDVARITQGRVTLRTERLSLAAIIHSAVEANRPQMEQRNLLLSVSLPPEDLRVEADPARAEQIVVNLLTNAAKYTEPGGRIAVTGDRQGDEAVIRVRDSGMGIVADVLPRVFDLFAQSPRALDRSQGGLGIGLTIVRRLVELHGGRVEAHSEGAGRGAEFVVRLPALPAAPAEAAPAPAPVESPLPTRARVVVVEDNPDTAESLTMLLEVLGHHVRAVHDGPSALEVAQANVPDVMLIDIGLPGMDGHEVARRVRQHPKLQRMVLVALTGYGREEDRERALAAGFDYHIVKPVNPDTLQGLVARLATTEPEKPSTVH